MGEHYTNSQLGFDIPHSMNLSRPRDRCLFLLSFLTYAYASVGSFVSLSFGLVDIEESYGRTRITRYLFN